MKHLFILIFLISFGFKGVSQSKFLIGNGKYKYLPFEVSLSYQNPDYVGIRIAIENPIIVNNSLDVVLGKPVYSKTEVLTRMELRNLLFSYGKENHHEIQLGFSTSYRKIFPSGFILEPIIGYQYGFAYNTSTFDRLSHKHELFFQGGLGYTRSLKELTATLYYIRPGVSFELTNENKKKNQFIIDIGVQFLLSSLKVERWNSPLFSKKKKPNEEFEFMGKNSGNPSSKNYSDRKRYKLNKKKRKYRTGRKKMKSKKKKK